MISSSSHLCKACGLCCNGVLFDTVRLQPSDSRAELKSLGMLIKHKKKYDFFHQPCSSFEEDCCSIYAQRPERCRLFECQQLKRLAAGETTEINVLETIAKACSQVEHVQQLLQRSCSLNHKKSLAQQYDKVLAEPIHESSGVKALEERSELVHAFQELQHFLNNEFRISPS
ncbi:MAG: YkgJ family cysteine cluster protein [Chthoniobacterales bacterium]